MNGFGISRRRMLGALLAAGVASTVASGSAFGADHLRIALNQSAASLPVIVAVSQGIFAKHGIDAETTVIPNIGLIPQLLGNQYDIGLTVAPIAFAAASKGIDVTLVAGCNFNSPDIVAGPLVVRPDINSVADLKGKTLAALTLTGSLHLATIAWLKHEGLDTTQVKAVQVAPANLLSQLKQGVIDAAEMTYPFVDQALKAGFKILGDPENLMWGKTVDTYWLASRPWASENGDLVTRFIAANDEAIAWIAAHADEAHALVAKSLDIPLEAANTIPLNWYQTSFARADIELWGNLMHDVGGFTGEIDYDKLQYKHP